MNGMRFWFVRVALLGVIAIFLHAGFALGAGGVVEAPLMLEDAGRERTFHNGPLKFTEIKSVDGTTTVIYTQSKNGKLYVRTNGSDLVHTADVAVPDRAITPVERAEFQTAIAAYDSSSRAVQSARDSGSDINLSEAIDYLNGISAQENGFVVDWQDPYLFFQYDMLSAVKRALSVYPLNKETLETFIRAAQKAYQFGIIMGRGEGRMIAPRVRLFSPRGDSLFWFDSINLVADWWNLEVDDWLPHDSGIGDRAALREAFEYALEHTELRRPPPAFGALSLSRGFSDLSSIIGGGGGGGGGGGAGMPLEVSNLYTLELSEDNKVLTIEMNKGAEAGERLRGNPLTVERTSTGGLALGLEDNSPFSEGAWVEAGLAQLVKDWRYLDDLQGRGYSLNRPLHMLVVSAGGAGTRRLAFVFDTRPEGTGGRELVTICSEVTFLRFGGAGGRSTVRKPVLYLYPEKPVNVTVKVDVPSGDFVTKYPLPDEDGAWRVVASPDGSLRDMHQGRRTYPYLFWEAKTRSGTFRIDPSLATLVPGAEAMQFLERVANAYDLNNKERADFITYWLMVLSKNRYSLVQLLEPDVYGKYAQTEITPPPDKFIRLIMLIQEADGNENAGNPAFKQHQRHGFTVVEWGGINLDENEAKPQVLSSRAWSRRPSREAKFQVQDLLGRR